MITHITIWNVHSTIGHSNPLKDHPLCPKMIVMHLRVLCPKINVLPPIVSCPKTIVLPHGDLSQNVCARSKPCCYYDVEIVWHTYLPFFLPRGIE